MYFEGSVEGCWILIGGLGGMGGVQFLVVIMVGFLMVVVEVDEICIDFRICMGYLDKKV